MVPRYTAAVSRHRLAVLGPIILDFLSGLVFIPPQSQQTPSLNCRVLLVTLQLTWMDGLLLTSVQLGRQTCRPWSWWWRRAEPGWGKKPHWWHWKLPGKAARSAWCRRQTRSSSRLARKSGRALPEERGTLVSGPPAASGWAARRLCPACLRHEPSVQLQVPLLQRIW